jgi:hypothetical protein
MRRSKKHGARAALALLFVAVFALPARGGSPVASCPPAFQGPLTFDETLDAYPPSGEYDPMPILEAYDQNNDDKLCVLELPEAFGFNSLIDNVATRL